jgi:hypothetical protein
MTSLAYYERCSRGVAAPVMRRLETAVSRENGAE